MAIVRSYRDLHHALRAWSTAQHVTRQQLDTDAGLANGHAGKLLAPVPVKHLSHVTLGRVLAALGLALVLVRESDLLALPAPNAAEDASADARITNHWRNNKGQAWGRRMAARRALKMTAEQRRASARKAAQARWQRARETVETPAADA